MLQIGDYFDRDLPEDAFKEAPAAVVQAPAPNHGAGFTYDRATGLPMISGMSSDADGQLNYDSMIQLSKDNTKQASGFSYNPKTGLPNVVGDEIDYDHDFVQFKGEPINSALRSRNLLQTGDDWMAAQSDFYATENLPVPKRKPTGKSRVEGWNTVVTI